MFPINSLFSWPIFLYMRKLRQAGWWWHTPLLPALGRHREAGGSLWVQINWSITPRLLNDNFRIESQQTMSATMTKVMAGTCGQFLLLQDFKICDDINYEDGGKDLPFVQWYHEKIKLGNLTQRMECVCLACMKTWVWCQHYILFVCLFVCM